MNQKIFWKHYDIRSVLKVSVCFERAADGLEQILTPFQIERSEPFETKIFLCSKPSQIPTDGKRVSGKYKGVSWIALLKKQKEIEGYDISFWSAGFTSFLIHRVILIPLLRETLVRVGGYEFTGSAFEYHEKVFVLLGLPGSKKTKLTLDAVGKGAQFVGDDEVIVSRGHQVTSFLDDLELRYNTIAGTDFWNKLSITRKMRLWVYRLIALFTFGKVSFNIVLDPKELGISGARAENEKIIFIILGKFPKIQSMSVREMSETLTQHEKGYEYCYGALFKDGDDEAGRKRVWDRLFTGCSLWFVPRETKIDEVLGLT